MDEGHVVHLGRIDFRNDHRLFGIKHDDRYSHVYVIGKTGTGKSTLLETMALQDLECGNGFALIDPHGDLVARIAAARPLSHHFRPAVRWRAAPIPRTRINTLALGARLPTMSVFRQYVDAGGLMSYGSNFPDIFRPTSDIGRPRQRLAGCKMPAIPAD